MISKKRTVDNHVQGNIFSKTGAKNRVALFELGRWITARSGPRWLQLLQPFPGSLNQPGKRRFSNPRHSVDAGL